MFLLSKCSQYGLKWYANGLKCANKQCKYSVCLLIDYVWCYYRESDLHRNVELRVHYRMLVNLCEVVGFPSMVTYEPEWSNPQTEDGKLPEMPKNR